MGIASCPNSEAEGEVILTPAAQAAARGAGLFPGLTARLMHEMSALLPDPAGQPRRLAAGKDVPPALNDRLFRALTALGRSASSRLNELGSRSTQRAAGRRSGPH